MAKFTITSKTTVGMMKQRFKSQVGGTLRIYKGGSEASNSDKLVSLGAREGSMECRTSRTVGKFIESFQKELRVKVKVYTKDNWVAVLDGITLSLVKKIPRNASKAQMEQYIGYQKSSKGGFFAWLKSLFGK